MTPAVRRRVEAAVDALIELLDAVDGDPDIEADDPLEDDLGEIEGRRAPGRGGLA